jgi:hypothetical protein
VLVGRDLHKAFRFELPGQAALIQKVGAQLEASKRAPQMVANDH